MTTTRSLIFTTSRPATMLPDPFLVECLDECASRDDSDVWILHVGGWFVLLNIDPWSMREWILYRYFPAASEMDEQDFLPVPQLTKMMRQAGFADVRVQRERRETMESLKNFLDFASQRHRASHFMALSDEMYQAGICQLRHEIQEATTKTPRAHSEMCFVTIQGNKR